MITVQLNLLSMPRLPRLSGEDLAAIAHDSALGAAVVVRRNFLRLSSGSGSRHFWHRAAGSVSVPDEVQGTTAAVVVRARGVRLHWRGGTVHPTGQASAVTGRPTRSLLIPFADSPMRKRGATLAEALHNDGLTPDNVHVIKSKGGCPILVAAKAMKRKTNLIWLGKLVKQATHKPRPEVMPAPQDMAAAAVAAARSSLKKKLSDKNTPPAP